MLYSASYYVRVYTVKEQFFSHGSWKTFIISTSNKQSQDIEITYNLQVFPVLKNIGVDDE